MLPSERSPVRLWDTGPAALDGEREHPVHPKAGMAFVPEPAADTATVTETSEQGENLLCFAPVCEGKPNYCNPILLK